MKLESIIDKLKSLIDKNTSSINAIGTVTRATGTCTTVQWADGTNTGVWNAPSAGTYIVMVKFYYASGKRLDYVQFWLRGLNGATIYPDNNSNASLFYKGGTGQANDALTRTFTTVAEAPDGSSLVPHIFTDTAGTVYNTTITAVRIK